jgi:hypothetical protein
VDNCDPGEFSVFSRVFHDVSGPPTIGPYSPTRPDETMLSDSLTNLNDAPMPAALVKPAIAAGPGPAPGISGVGFLTAVDKHVVYNRDGATQCLPGGPPPGGDQAPHCLTAPFYGAYIPPSPTMENNPANTGPLGGPDDPDTASGIHGSFANDFDGYLPVSYDPPGAVGPQRGLYHYWDIIETRRLAAGGTLPPECVAQGFRPVSGAQEIVLYTDEHGEAQFKFNAGVGLQPGAFSVDEQQRACVAEGLIGLADISVAARYPFQPTTSVGSTSNALQKRIQSLFQKGVVCVPKAADPQAALCVIFARDFTGNPVLDEEVCLLIGLRPPAAGDVSGVQVILDGRETRRLDRSACGILDDVTPPDAITDLFPAGTIPGTTTPCGPSGDLDEFSFLVFKVDGAGSLKATAKFEREHLERSCFFSIPPGEQPPPPAPPITPPPTPQVTPPPTPQVTPPPTPQITPPPTPQVTPPPPTPPIVQTVQTTEQTTTTTRPPTTTRRPTTTVKAKKKITAKKKVKKVKRARACIIRGRVVRPCVRGKG